MLKALFFSALMLTTLAGIAQYRTDLDEKSGNPWYHPKFQAKVDSIIAKLPPVAKPTPNQVMRLCNYVQSQDFGYKTILKEISGVTNNDSRLVTAAKIQLFWKKFYNDCACRAEGFVLNPGNVLKLAVNRDFVRFIDGFLRDNGININIIDKNDGATVLDFSKNEIERFKEMPGDQSETIKQYEQIYAHLREIGAKHARELK